MTEQNEYKVNEDVLKALKETEKDFKHFAPKDRLEARSYILDMATDVMRQCQQLGRVMSNDEVMLAISKETYFTLFKNLRLVALDMTKFTMDLTSMVPSKPKVEPKEDVPDTRLIS